MRSSTDDRTHCESNARLTQHMYLQSSFCMLYAHRVFWLERIDRVWPVLRVLALFGVCWGAFACHRALYRIRGHSMSPLLPFSIFSLCSTFQSSFNHNSIFQLFLHWCQLFLWEGGLGQGEDLVLEDGLGLRGWFRAGRMV